MARKLTTAGDILAERTCKRLADLAHKMAKSKEALLWPELREELQNLNAGSFQMVYDLANNSKRSVMSLIEKAVNDNTNQQVKDTHGEFTFGDDFLDMFDDDVVNLITFDPKNCMDSKERYAALMVVQQQHQQQQKPGRQQRQYQ